MKDKMESKTKMGIAGILIGLLVVVFFIFEVPKQKKEINPNDLTFNTSKLEDLKYEIHIDCKWISEHLEDDTVWFPNKTRELCESFFPELFELNVLINERKYGK